MPAENLLLQYVNWKWKRQKRRKGLGLLRGPFYDHPNKGEVTCMGIGWLSDAHIKG